MYFYKLVFFYEKWDCSKNFYYIRVSQKVITFWSYLVYLHSVIVNSHWEFMA